MIHPGHHLCVIGGSPHWAQVGFDYCIYHSGGRQHPAAHLIDTAADSEALTRVMHRSHNGWRHGMGAAGDVISWKRPL